MIQPYDRSRSSLLRISTTLLSYSHEVSSLATASVGKGRIPRSSSVHRYAFPFMPSGDLWHFFVDGRLVRAHISPFNRAMHSLVLSQVEIILSTAAKQSIFSRNTLPYAGLSCVVTSETLTCTNGRLQAESGAYLRDSSRVPRRRPLINSNCHTPSDQSQVYRVTQLRTDGVHCRESAGTGPVNLKIVPNGCCLGRSP